MKFKSYFQLLPTQADIAPAFFGVIQQYGWKRVALIVQNENLFTVVSFIQHAGVCMDLHFLDTRVSFLFHLLDGTSSEDPPK